MTDTGSRPATPGWSKLLQELRLSRGYSARKAASLAGLSDSFWGVCEKGFVPVKGKKPRLVHPSRPSLLTMTQALRASPSMTNAILTSAGYKPIPAIGEQPDPAAEVDLRGLTSRDIVVVNSVAQHLREIRRSSASQRQLRSETFYEQPASEWQG